MKQPFGVVCCLIASIPLVATVATAQIEEPSNAARRVSCLEAKTATEFHTYIVDSLEADQLEQVRACFNELTADSPQLRFFHDLADADDPSGNDRFGAGVPLSVIALYNTYGNPGPFQNLLDRVAELESRLIEDDPGLGGLLLQMVDAQGSSGLTALHYTVGGDYPDQAEILLEAGADAQTIRDEDGLTASELATIMRTVSPNVYSLFKARGIDTPVPDR